MALRSKYSVDNLFPPLRFPSQNFDDGDGGEPGGGSGGTGGDAGGTGGDANGASPPEGFQIDSGGSIWDPPAPAAAPTGGTPAAAPIVTPTPSGGTPTPTPSEAAMAQFDTRVAGLAFSPLALNEEQVGQMFDNRDVGALNDFIHGGLREAYKHAMVDSVRMMNTMREQIEAKIRTEAQSVTTQNDNINALRAALPFTSNPNISPIADAALNTQIGAGKNIDEAIKTVRAFFKQSAQISSKDLELGLPPSGDPGDGSFRQGAEGEEVDWDALLSGVVVKQAGE